MDGLDGLKRRAARGAAATLYSIEDPENAEPARTNYRLYISRLFARVMVIHSGVAMFESQANLVGVNSNVK